MGWSKKKPGKDSAQPDVVDKVPLLPYRLLYTEIPFYKDPDCHHRVENASICILLPLDPNDDLVEYEIVPTTKTYQPGDYVTWSLNSKKLWEDCYFKHPETGKVEKAWNTHVEFLGAVISKNAVEEKRSDLEDMERETRSKLKPSKGEESIH